MAEVEGRGSGGAFAGAGQLSCKGLVVGLPMERRQFNRASLGSDTEGKLSDIHIVWLTPDGDKILDRLARLLAEGAGWTLSDRPRDGVDLNYAMIYVDFAQRFSDWRKTPWAAYFSHFEPDTPYKKFWWEMAAPLIDIKTVTADQYGRLLKGEVIKVIPPVDP